MFNSWITMQKSFFLSDGIVALRHNFVFRFLTPARRLEFGDTQSIFSDFCKICIFLSVSVFALILMNFPQNFTNFPHKLPKSPGISKMLGIIVVAGFPIYQLFRIIDNWGWGFGPEVAGVMCQTAGRRFGRIHSRLGPHRAALLHAPPWSQMCNDVF